MSVLLNQQHGWIFILILAGLVFAAFRLYRRTPPSVSPALRSVLLALRIVAIAVVVLVLLEPVLRRAGVRRERPIVAVLLDTSRSMSIADGTGGARRGDEAVELLNEVVIPRVARDAELRAFGFDRDLESIDTDRGAMPGEVSFGGSVTDLPAALSGLRNEIPDGLAAVILATDGASNLGGSVIGAWEALGAPVYALGVGSEVETRDIAVREVLTNRISYVGEALPIEATIQSAGFPGGSTTVELSEDGQIIDQATVDLSETGEESVVRFRAVPSSPGVHRYVVAVPSAPDELSDANNKRVVVTNTLGGKIEALLVASLPSWDYAFVKRELGFDGNVELDALTLLEGPRGSPPGGVAGSSVGGGQVGSPAPSTARELLEYDLLILIEPGRRELPFPAEWVDRFLRERGGGLLVISGLSDVGGTSEALERLLPLFGSDGPTSRPSEKRIKLTASGETSPVLRVVDGRYENSTLWEALPPIWIGDGRGWTLKPDATVLAEAGSGEGEPIPVVATSRVGAGNVIVFAASGLWRWKMAGPSEPDVFDVLLANATRWLTARGELSRVTAETDKDVYAAGERVRVSAQVYQSDYRLARDASVSVDVSTGQGAAPVESIVLTPDGDFYRGEADPLPPGRYLFLAEGTAGGETIGVDSGEFVVEEFSLEDAEVRRRSGILRRLADESGGDYMSPETIDDLPESVPLEWRAVSVRREFELWNSPWPLIAIVGLLATEWAIRRSKGMP